MRNVILALVTVLFSCLFLTSCLKYDKEMIHLTLNPRFGDGEISYFVENITSDEKTPEKKASEIQELLRDHKKGKYEKEFKEMGLKSVKSKLTKKDNGNYDGKISGKFNSLSMLCWKGELIKEFKMDNKSLQMDFASSDFPSTIIIESKIPILMSNTPNTSENKLTHTWSFEPKQRRLVFIEFQ
ncbi:MAG: hypothetical protein HYY61_00355 [Deltaproteobacteria bacterium]|nr:hypothetical protein [Deltaproteobacteria bacterium]